MSWYYKNISPLFNKLNFIAVLLFAFWIPLYPKAIPWLVGFLLTTWFFDFNFKEKIANFRQLKYSKSAFYIFLAFTLLHIIGFFYSENQKAAVFDLQVKISLFIFPFAFATISNIVRKNYKYVFLAFIIGNILASAICLTQGLNNAISLDGNNNLIVNFSVWGSTSHLSFIQLILERYSYISYSYLSYFHHPSYFSMYLALAITFSFYFIKNNEFRIKNIVWYSSIVFLSIILFLLQSRAGLLLLITILLGNIIALYIKNFRKVLSIFIILFCIAFISTFFYINKMGFIENVQNVQQVDSVHTENLRLNIWSAGIDVAKDNYAFGVGIGDVKDSMIAKYRERNQEILAERVYNVHNQFFEIFIGLGIPGMTVFIAILIIPLINFYKRKDFISLFFIAIIVISFLFESILNRLAGIVFFAFFYNFVAYVFIEQKFLPSNNKNDSIFATKNR